MAKLWQFSQGHPKPAFSEKVQRGDQGKFFKNSPRSKGPVALWRKWHYPLISMHLKCKDWGRFWRKKRLKECPNWQVMAILEWSTKTRIFWKKSEGGTKGNFSKIAQKVALVWMAKQPSRANSIILQLVCTWSAKTGEDFGANSGSKHCPNGQVIEIFPRSPNTCIFWKSAKEGPREIFQKSPKN